MRDREQRLVDGGVPVQEQVEIECSRSHRGSGAPIAAEGALELQQDAEERTGGEGRLELDDAVQEARLVDVADGCSVAEAGDGSHVHVRDGAKTADRGLQRRLTLTEVGPETDEGARHAGSLEKRSTLRRWRRGSCRSSSWPFSPLRPPRRPTSYS